MSEQNATDTYDATTERQRVSLRNLQLRPLFLGAFLVGLALIFLSGFIRSSALIVLTGLVMPLMIMMAYVGIGRVSQHASDYKEQFADSIYYLGFLFTLSSLCASLISLRGSEPELGALVARFGLALITTIFGLAIRVAIVNFMRSADESQRIAERNLQTAVERFTSQVQSVSDRFEYVLKELATQVYDAGKTLISDSSDRLQELRQETETHHKELGEASAAAIKQLNDKHTQAAKRFESSLTSVLDTVTESLTQTSRSAESAFQSLGELPVDFAMEARANLEVLGKAQGKLSREIQNRSTGLSKAATKLASAQDGLESLTEAAKNSAVGLHYLNDEGRAMKDTAQALSETQTQLCEFASHVHGIKAEMQVVGTSLATFAARLDQATAQLTKTSAESHTAALKLQDNLIDAANSIVRHLGKERDE